MKRSRAQFGSSFFTSLRGYRAGNLRPDVVAGLTVWAVMVPEALAYATIAGVPAVVGLYAAIPALILYAALGSSRHLVVGPMSATAALSAAIIAPLTNGDTATYIALTAALAIVTGILGVVAGLVRLGFIASFISEPVLKGFIVGLALTIIIGQVPALLGIEKNGGNFFEQLRGVLGHIGEVDWIATSIGLTSLVAILILRRWLPLVPGSLIVVAAGVLAVSIGHLDERGVEIVGHIDSGLPTLGLPPATAFGDYLELIGPAVGVLLIGFAEGLAAAKTYADRHGYTIDANRELTALGGANLGSGLCAGMAVNGSLSKTAVNGGAGARTQLSGLVVASLTIVTLLLLTGLFEQLPEATLAAVVIAAVIELVDVSALRSLFGVWTARLGDIYGRAARVDFLAAIAAMLGVLVFDTLPGLVIGIGVSILLLLYRVSRPHVASLGRAGTRWVDLEHHPEVHSPEHAVVLRVESSVLFANADHVCDEITRRVMPDTTVVVLDAETSPVIDVTAARMLATLHSDLGARGVELRVARDVGQFRDVLSAALSDPIPFYSSVAEALAD